MVDDRAEFLGAGMNAVVTKPINFTELLRVINHVLGETIHENAAGADPQSAGNAPHNTKADALADLISGLDSLSADAKAG